MSLLSIVLNARDLGMNKTEKNTNYSLKKFMFKWEELVNRKISKEIYQTIFRLWNKQGHNTLEDGIKSLKGLCRGTAWDKLVTEVLSGKSWKLKGEKELSQHRDRGKSYQAKETARA